MSAQRPASLRPDTGLDAVAAPPPDEGLVALEDYPLARASHWRTPLWNFPKHDHASKNLKADPARTYTRQRCFPSVKLEAPPGASSSSAPPCASRP